MSANSPKVLRDVLSILLICLLLLILKYAGFLGTPFLGSAISGLLSALYLPVYLSVGSFFVRAIGIQSSMVLRID